MRVLIIGGTGFLSAAVARQLAEARHELTLFTRGQRKLPETVDVIHGDRKDYAAFVERLRGAPFDAVVDCICYDPEDAEADIRAFADRGIQLVMISTDFVYGTERRLPMDEQTPRKALNTYGARKAACEDLFFAAAREGR